MEDPGATDPRRTVVLLARHLDGSGGVTRSVSNLANALAGAGLDVALVALFRRGKPRYELDERIAISYLRSLRPRALASLGPRARALDARPSELCDPGEGMTALTDRRLAKRSCASWDPARSSPTARRCTRRPPGGLPSTW